MVGSSLTDEEDYRGRLECEKPYRDAPEKVGIFATRSPIRPNPILLTVVNIITIVNERIYVAFIDAEEGTPVIDIKPYHPATDRVKDLEVPKWCSHWPKWYEDSADFDW